LRAALALEHSQANSKPSSGIPCAKDPAYDRRRRFCDQRPPPRGPPALSDRGRSFS
jgi:hypothetical protein